MECSDTTALSSYVLVNDTLLVNESSPTEENGALYQSIAGNTTMSQRIDTMFVFVLCGIFMPENADFTGFSGCFIVCCECRKFRRALISFFETPILLSIAAVPPTNR